MLQIGMQIASIVSWFSMENGAGLPFSFFSFFETEVKSLPHSIN
jgi:hypothetical protein